MTTATATTRSRAKKPAAPPFSAPIAEVHLVPLDLIDVEEQIRKEFNQESIEELAGDIAERGLMQPILLNPTPSGRFTLISGERRLRAIKQNGQEGIPALLTKASTEDALLMQLAENIQRQELTLQEEAYAVGKLYERLKNLEEVAKLVHRSKGWCSKRYSMTLSDKLSWKAKQLVEKGVTEDLELIKAYSSLESMLNYNEGYAWYEKILKGEAGREEIREALKDTKAKAKAAAEKEAAKLNKVSHAKPKKETPWHSFSVWVKHARTGEMIKQMEMSAKRQPNWEHYTDDFCKLGLDGEIRKGEEVISSWKWVEEETKRD